MSSSSHQLITPLTANPAGTFMQNQDAISEPRNRIPMESQKSKGSFFSLLKHVKHHAHAPAAPSGPSSTRTPPQTNRPSQFTTKIPPDPYFRLYRNPFSFTFGIVDVLRGVCARARCSVHRVGGRGQGRFKGGQTGFRCPVYEDSDLLVVPRAFLGWPDWKPFLNRRETPLR